MSKYRVEVSEAVADAETGQIDNFKTVYCQTVEDLDVVALVNQINNQKPRRSDK